jgi:hypothetical protein
LVWSVLVIGSGAFSTTAALAQQPIPQGASMPGPEAGAAAAPAQDVEVQGSRDPLHGLTLTPGLSIPLSRGPSPDESSPVRNGGSTMATLTARYEPRESWFATVTGYAYLEPDRRQPWQGDFSYAFGYDDWRPNTFSLLYSNYGNNRASGQDAGERFLEGTVSGAYKFNLPAVIAEPMLIDRSQTIGCRVAYNVSPRYERENGSIASDKHSAQAGCRYPIWKRAYFDWTVYTYLRGEQRSWDPDFTYGFGWFDWRPHRVSVQYSNYSGNRWPGREPAPRTGRFRDGQVTVTWGHAF